MSTFCTNDILTLASGVYADLNSPPSISVAFISGVFTSSGTLGQMNTRLSQSFYLSGDGPCIAGGFGAEESSIMALMFEHDWYKRESLRALQGSTIISVRDGDGGYTREGATKLSSEYRALHKEAQEELYVLTAQYVRNHSMCVSVDAASLASWPSP